jgi:hypothetical protein
VRPTLSTPCTAARLRSPGRPPQRVCPSCPRPFVSVFSTPTTRARWQHSARAPSCALAYLRAHPPLTIHWPALRRSHAAACGAPCATPQHARARHAAVPGGSVQCPVHCAAPRSASSLNFAPVRGVGSPVSRSMQSMVCAHGSGGVPCQGAAPPRVFSCIAVGFQPLWWVCNHLPGRTGVKSEFTDALAQGMVASVGAPPPPGEAVCRGVCVTSHCDTRKAATRGWCHLFSRLMWGKLLHGGTRGRLHRRAWAAAGVA